MRILLCEDDTDTTEYYMALLGNLGIEVRSVPNGADALNALKHSAFDGVITDYRMPKADGASVSRYCETAGIRCVLVTSIAMAEVRPLLGPSTVAVDKIDFSQLLADAQDVPGALTPPEDNFRQILFDLLNGAA